MKRCSGNINFTKSDRWPSPSSFRALVFKQQSIISLLTGVTCQFLLLSKSQQFHDRGLFSLPFLSLVMVRAIYACMNAFSFNFTPKLRPKSPLFPSPQLHESTSGFLLLPGGVMDFLYTRCAMPLKDILPLKDTLRHSDFAFLEFSCYHDMNSRVLVFGRISQSLLYPYISCLFQHFPPKLY